MKLFEDHLRDWGVEWLRLKIYSEKQIAIGYFLPQKIKGNPDMKRDITVAVFRPSIDLMGQETIGMPMATMREFRKKDRKIAHWYYKELRRAYKNGVLQTGPGLSTRNRDERR